MVEYYESHHNNSLFLQLVMRGRGATAIEVEVVLELGVDV